MAPLAPLRTLLVSPSLLLALSLANACAAALPIELEVAAQSDSPFGAMQEWNKVLAEMDLARVRLRGAHAGDAPSIEVDEYRGRKVYRVLGMLNRSDELVLPGGKFRQGDRDGLKQFFQDLPRRQDEAGIERVRFGLTPEQLAAVMVELAKTVDEPTQDGSPHELLGALTAGCPLPVAGEISVRATLRDAAPFRSQMKGLTLGTTLAAMLRGAGLQFTPDTLGAEPLTLRVVPLDASVESWPVGWKLVGGPRLIAPAMYRITNIELANFTLDKAIAALAPHMGVPIVIDQRTLAARKIDPTTVKVKLPRSKTYPRNAFDRILAQGRLAGELRVDEAGTPFYWVTQFGKESPRAVSVDGAN